MSSPSCMEAGPCGHTYCSSVLVHLGQQEIPGLCTSQDGRRVPQAHGTISQSTSQQARLRKEHTDSEYSESARTASAYATVSLAPRPPYGMHRNGQLGCRTEMKDAECQKKQILAWRAQSTYGSAVSDARRTQLL